MIQDHQEAMRRLDAQTKEHPADLSGLNLSNISFVGRDVTGVNFQNACLIEADFTGVDLTKANFTNANVSYASFRNAYLDETVLYQTEGIQADFTNSNLHNLHISKCKFQRAIFAGATRVNVHLAYTQIHGGLVIGYHINYDHGDYEHGQPAK